ncbi:MAG TPA: alcohol dehydrogenase, partial [Marinobacter sp.]|nr:alcohol dehydrogenase [Marinobacter sp.]
EDFAGGLPMLTPLGAIYSTNITPDKETGIGSYTFDDFNNATKHGVRKDGSALYPAMPYPSYQIMPDQDVAAMYAYFMSGVKAVNQPNRKSELPPILNWRWPLAYW